MTAHSSQQVRSTGTNEDIILEIRDARVTFGMERGESRVLDDVNLTIRRGEIMGIVGESGSGKSMLASSLLNAVVEPGKLTGDVIYHPKDGDPVNVVAQSGSDLKRLRWNEISFVIQSAQSSFNPTMSIRNHFIETLDAHDVDIEEGMDRARELLSDVYLKPEQVFSSHPHQLSGGMKQRALIALSLVLEPEILVMDEPTAALDLLMQRSIISLLFDLKQKYDLTLVFVTHDLPLVADIADRLAVMYAFEIAEVAPTQRILTDARHPYTRMLIDGVPDIHAPASESAGIPGSSPDPVHVPSGCSFRPRCPLGDEQCVEVDPQLEATDEEHLVACHHWENAAAQVPVRLGEDAETYGGDE